MIAREDLYIRDPFLVCEGGRYVLFESNGHGVSARESTDLQTFSDPTVVFTPPEGFWATQDFWAPEVHRYGGAYYLFLSLKSPDACRGTQIFRSDALLGPYEAISDGPVTPRDWECLDGTLYLEDGRPYMVFCREWLQVQDGEMYAMPLTDDLTAAAGEPVFLFSASQSGWAQAMDKEGKNFITDGPFLHRTADGTLLMLWSSFRGPYCEAVSVSESGKLAGPWRHESELLYTDDGGHGMLFRDTAGRLCLILHAPNRGPERAKIFFVREDGGRLTLLPYEN